MSDVQLECPYHAIIPYVVQVDKSISPSEKLFFGQIVGLSKKFGYIWATDEQLSQMVETPIDTIGKWLKNLENAGHIKRETEMEYLPNEKNNGIKRFIKKRKIYILEKGNTAQIQKDQEKNNSKKDCQPVKNDDFIEPVKNDDSMNPSKMTDITSNSKRENIKQQPEAPSAVVVSLISNELEKLDIEDSLRMKISREFKFEDVKLAVERALNWKSRPSDAVGIMTALKKKDDWMDPPSKEEKIESNEKFLKNLEHLDGTTIANTQITIGKTYIEFVSGMKVDIYSTEDNDFKILVNKYFDYLKTLQKK